MISAIARHEAAHAVIAEAFGVRVTRVTIERFHDFEGRFEGLCEYDKRFKRGPLIQALIAMAGTSAEQLWHGVPLTKVSRLDAARIERFDVFHGLDWGALQDISRMLVRERARPIKRVAQRLMQAQTLTGKEVRALL